MLASDLQKQIYGAVSKKDLKLTRDLLTSNPSEVNKRAAGLSWLDRATSSNQGNIEMVKLLLELGAAVNPEGVERTPLAYAIPSADLEIVRLLLQHDANPNGDRCIIGALNRNADKLTAVKLLVEHGADVNKVFDLEGTETTFTALDWAKDPEVVAYLKSIGAKTSAEISRQGISGEAELDELAEVIQFFGDTFGEVDTKSFIEIVPSGHPIAVNAIPPFGKRKHWTLFTTGLSSTKMNAPDGLEEYSLAELFIQLPGDWEFASSNPRWSWPVNWLRRIAQYPLDNDIFLGGPVTIIANNDPLEPLAPGTNFTSLLLVAEKSFKRSDGCIVQLYRVAPIYSNERELEIMEGAPALMRAFDRNNVSPIVDLHRPSVVTKN